MPHRRGNTQIKILVAFPERTTSLLEAEEIAADWVRRLGFDRRIPEAARIEAEVLTIGPDGEFMNASQFFDSLRELRRGEEGNGEVSN